jgi:hypothetical protein
MTARSGYSTGGKFVRVTELLDRLASTRRGLTTPELAGTFEVNVRSAQRYIRQLRDDVGLDIVAEDGRHRLGERSKLPALQFDRDRDRASARPRRRPRLRRGRVLAAPPGPWSRIRIPPALLHRSDSGTRWTSSTGSSSS